MCGSGRGLPGRTLDRENTRFCKPGRIGDQENTWACMGLDVGFPGARAIVTTRGFVSQDVHRTKKTRGNKMKRKETRKPKEPLWKPRRSAQVPVQWPLAQSPGESEPSPVVLTGHCPRAPGDRQVDSSAASSSSLSSESPRKDPPLAPVC